MDLRRMPPFHDHLPVEDCQALTRTTAMVLNDLNDVAVSHQLHGSVVVVSSPLPGVVDFPQGTAFGGWMDVCE